MEKLKPCPFCGQNPRVKHGLNSEGNPYVQITHDCINFLSQIKTFCYPTAEKAISDWNRRAAPENKPLTLEQLRKMQRQPVYCIGQTRFDVHFDGWKVVTKNNSMVNVIRFTDGMDFPVEVYGKRLLAYARKPEGGEKP